MWKFLVLCLCSSHFYFCENSWFCVCVQATFWPSKEQEDSNGGNDAVFAPGAISYPELPKVCYELDPASTTKEILQVVRGWWCHICLLLLLSFPLRPPSFCGASRWNHWPSLITLNNDYPSRIFSERGRIGLRSESTKNKKGDTKNV